MKKTPKHDKSKTNEAYKNKHRKLKSTNNFDKQYNYENKQPKRKIKKQTTHKYKNTYKNTA